MISTCPLCASALDALEGLCRTCSWSVPYLVRHRAPARQQVSFTERYRGTPFQAPQATVMLDDSGMARGRRFVAVAMVATVSLVSLIMVSQPYP